MSYSVTPTEAGCYPGTTVLINKLGIRSQEALDEVERVVTSLHSVEIEREQSAEVFTFGYYLELHRRLFGDIYDWAGQIRTIELSKKGTSFCAAGKIPSVGQAIFERLQRLKEFRGLPRKRFVREAADLYNRINLLHPFREGNGRTQRLFFTLLVRRAGREIDFANCDTDVLMIATIFAAQGVMDQLYGFFDQEIKG